MLDEERGCRAPIEVSNMPAVYSLTAEAQPIESTMADPITYDHFAKLDLRIAKVLEARPHPNADKLLLLQVDLGDEQKQIVAGIKQHYSPEDLVGRLIVVVNNLEPAMLRGEASNGMLLAASSGDKVVLLTPADPECLPGSKVK
ncbi:methionine--tRNA ligase subunit beta [Tautonia rosea]|uniref:methionine--tRNA ligase subunit beta n=1 Tax=Tautonia rosea TaxID=2728037 RepID=UPI001472DAB2|nr:methionine--tRNA ligase subunit beta [Tautonia rosea]